MAFGTHPFLHWPKRTEGRLSCLFADGRLFREDFIIGSPAFPFKTAGVAALPRGITRHTLGHRSPATGKVTTVGTDGTAGAQPEAKWLLDVQRFLGELEVWLKARAKKNVSVWLSTQELADVQRTTLWQAVLASMPTRILLPNPQALSAPFRPFYTDVGVSDRGRRQLAQAQPFRDYLYVSPLGMRLFQCTLSPVERLLCAASRLEELAVLDTLAAEVPPDMLPAAWLRHWGYDEEAAFLMPEKKETSDAPIPS